VPRTFLRIELSLLAWLCTAAALLAQDSADPVVLQKHPPMLTLTPQQYADDASAEQAALELEQKFPEQDRPEAVKMLLDLLRGPRIGAGDGWFGPAETRFDWKWLCFQQGWDPAAIKELSREQFMGPDLAFGRLDRDGDGAITPDDLDWSAASPWVQQAQIVTRLFRRINAAGDGRLTRQEIENFFDRAAHDQEQLSLGDFRDALLRGSGSFAPGDEPSREVLIRGFFANELGSLHEGPALDETAPDFTLSTRDGAETYQLSKLIGERPVVLVLGNFTCGPFRAMYPEVDTLHKRFGQEATFLMVYVREAHPEDGWAMQSNVRAKVAVKQPTTLAERSAVCDQFCQRLNPALPVVVDTLDDAVGNAYSGMPARMYIIDRQGKVAYKSGRGPFGFKVGEMEQALVMAILQAEEQKGK
jgi:hypothetical protein